MKTFSNAKKATQRFVSIVVGSKYLCIQLLSNQLFSLSRYHCNCDNKYKNILGQMLLSSYPKLVIIFVIIFMMIEYGDFLGQQYGIRKPTRLIKTTSLILEIKITFYPL